MAKKDRNREKEDRYLTLLGIFITAIFVFWLLFFYTLPVYSASIAQPEKDKFITMVKMCLIMHDNYPNAKNYIPEEIALTQAIVESGWGTSRFAKKGNALFGIRTWDLNEPHIKPLFNDNATFGLKKYSSYCDSVADYLHTLNTSSQYKKFRELRDKRASVIEMIEALGNYAEDPNYSTILINKMKELSFGHTNYSN